MRRYAALLLIALAVTACGKFDDGTHGPQPVPREGDWRSYGDMADFEVLADIKSIGHHERDADTNYTYVWMLQHFKNNQVDGTSKGVYRKKYMRQAIDCPSGRMAGVAVELRSEDDEIVARYDVPGYQWEFETPAPDTYGSDFVKQVCQIMKHEDDQAKNTNE
ncbi:surface-adhesin E family protein [Silvimonas amylolytica]|uniref:Surface-adhesin protein E-like domain-containing protein n=1 Tax=Silvimonas amylolytica TaxID=449663 RepID=A0ABQ2PQQ0_9NEIS|nr:surface-adhesin E family protein [Silvimonas amylolytica]GGP27782.1 hypothetical protein GCM10010971_36010 [Silvimonas amylolytica]